MSLIGYARVSSVDQSVEVQLEQLRAAGCEKIFSEKRSGSTTHRPALQDCLEYVREGDVLMVVRLDRLARSVEDLWKIIRGLEEKGAGFQCVLQGLETVTPAGKMMFTMLGAVAEFELDLKKERQAEGIARAQREGKYVRATKTTADKIVELKDSGCSVSEIARRLGIYRGTVYRTCPGIWGPPPVVRENRV